MKNHPMSFVPCPSLIIILGFLITSAFAGPVSHFGALKVCKINGKGYLCGGTNGTTSTAIQVKGPSLFWHSSGEGAPFYSTETVDWFVDNMKIGVIRAAMGIRYLKDNSDAISASGSTVLGYYDDAATSKRMIKTIVDAAIANDIYVIVDWHSHNATQELALARTFFREMATEYKNVPNVIFELFNEPVTPGTSAINSYSNAVLDEIRNAGNNNLVLIGSENWSSKPNTQASSWGTSDNGVTKNVAFTVHFYAATSSHSSYMGNADNAMSGGYAVFASEWGFSAAEGNGSVVQGSNFTTWMDNNTIGNCNWNVSAKNESSAMFTSGTTIANLLAGNATSRLTTSGNYFYQYMTNSSVKKWMDFIPSNHPKGNDITVPVNDGASVNLTSQLGLTGTVTGVSQPNEGTATYTSNSVTYTTSPSGTQSEKVRFTYEITQNNVTVKRRVIVNINNRKPYLPQKTPIAVSHKVPTVLRATVDLAASDPGGQTLSFKAVTLSNPSIGTVSTNKDTLIFTPAASQHNVSFAEVTLNYTIQNTGGISSSASVVLQLQNFAPTTNTAIVNGCCAGSKPNTAPIGIGIAQVGGRDKDGDSLWFDKLYLDPRYPGSIEQVKADSFVYYPENNKTGRVVFLSVITDGLSYSNVGKSALTLTGNGTAIGTITPPDNIPNYEPPVEPPLVSHPVFDEKFAVKYFGSGNVEVNFAQSGHAKLDVYSLSGKNMGTLFNGHQNAGSKEVSLKSFNLQKGVYILRLSQGSQVKTLRIVN
jgi:hypothetical protein